MIAIHDPRVSQIGDKYHVQCPCGEERRYSTKGAARAAAERGTCRKCKVDYRAEMPPEGVYKNTDGKWCSTCKSCDVEQAYTRKDHAVCSERVGWLCRECSRPESSRNWAIGPEARMFNKFRKSAQARGLGWELTQKEMFAGYEGTCAFTGWPISVHGERPTASLDRINNSCGYSPGNIQWVHVSVNMTRGKLSVEDFIAMCRAVADREKW